MIIVSRDERDSGADPEREEHGRPFTSGGLFTSYIP